MAVETLAEERDTRANGAKLRAGAIAFAGGAAVVLIGRAFGVHYGTPHHRTVALLSYGTTVFLNGILQPMADGDRRPWKSRLWWTVNLTAGAVWLFGWLTSIL